MKTVHLVYPHRPRIAAPHVIGYRLGKLLAERYAVRYYNLDESTRIRPAEGDVLIGHPWPVPFTCFRRSMRDPKWGRVIVMCPFHYSLPDVAFLEWVLPHADLFLAICGPYWEEAPPPPWAARWRAKMIRLDLAVDRSNFPPIKTTFNPPGRRRFVYIGNDVPLKNVDYLAALARRLPGSEFGWFGVGRSRPGVASLGYANFATAEAKAKVAGWDFLVNPARWDANPKTILEAMGWGLLPVCTPTSGYHGIDSIVNIPLDDVEGAAAVIDRLQHTSEDELRRMQRRNWELLDSHYNWPRFARQVIDAIESDASPVMAPAGRRERLAMLWNELRGPDSWLRPSALAHMARARAGRIARRLGWLPKVDA